jgi:WD40 repeat protein
LSADGKLLVTGSRDGTVRIWDLATAQTSKVLSAHFGEVGSVSLTGDSKRLVTTAWGECPRIWEVASGKELCRMVSFDTGGWAVFDAQNRFDSAKADQQGIYWVLGTESFPLQRFRDEFHDAGLLAKYMGFNKKPARKIGEEKGT